MLTVKEKKLSSVRFLMKELSANNFFYIYILRSDPFSAPQIGNSAKQMRNGDL